MLEGWAGKALITELAPEYGLSSLQPCDLRFNWDILQGFETQLWKHAIETHKPLLVVMPIHCTPWCIFNNNCNYKNRPEELMAWRDSERPGIKLAAWTCRTQAAGGRYYLLENPPTSQLKRQPEFQPIRDILSRMSGIGDMGAYGAMGKQLPIIQPMEFFCNDVGLLDAVTRRFDRSLPHEKVEGSVTTRSQEYTEEFCREVLWWLQSKAIERQRDHFNPVNVTDRYLKSYGCDEWACPVWTVETEPTFEDIRRDNESWQRVIQDAEAALAGRASPSWNVDDDTL